MSHETIDKNCAVCGGRMRKVDGVWRIFECICPPPPPPDEVKYCDSCGKKAPGWHDEMGDFFCVDCWGEYKEEMP